MQGSIFQPNLKFFYSLPFWTYWAKQDRQTEDVRYPCLTQINGNWSNSSRKCVTECAYIQNTSLLKFVGFNKDCDADQKR